jgi:hypothetical protein
MRNWPAMATKLATIVIMNRFPGGHSSIPKTQNRQERHECLAWQPVAWQCWTHVNWDLTGNRARSLIIILLPLLFGYHWAWYPVNSLRVYAVACPSCVECCTGTLSASGWDSRDVHLFPPACSAILALGPDPTDPQELWVTGHLLPLCVQDRLSLITTYLQNKTKANNNTGPGYMVMTQWNASLSHWNPAAHCNVLCITSWEGQCLAHLHSSKMDKRVYLQQMSTEWGETMIPPVGKNPFFYLDLQ